MTAQLIYNELMSRAIDKRMALRYVRFIKTFSNTGGKVKHHILPKAEDMWPEYSNLKNNKWNKSLLTERQHFVAHWILWKALGGSQTSAFWQMKHKNGEVLTSKVYEELRNDHYSRRKDIIDYDAVAKKTAKTKTSTFEANGKTIAQNTAAKSALSIDYESVGKKQSKTKSSKEWKNTVGKKSIQKRMDKMDYKEVGLKRKQTVNNPEWIEKNYKHCKYCNKNIHPGPYKRWHGDKCKNKGSE